MNLFPLRKIWILTKVCRARTHTIKVGPRCRITLHRTQSRPTDWRSTRLSLRKDSRPITSTALWKLKWKWTHSEQTNIIYKVIIRWAQTWQLKTRLSRRLRATSHKTQIMLTKVQLWDQDLTLARTFLIQKKHSGKAQITIKWLLTLVSKTSSHNTSSKWSLRLTPILQDKTHPDTSTRRTRYSSKGT
jgi:hypothetical protein